MNSNEISVMTSARGQQIGQNITLLQLGNISRFLPLILHTIIYQNTKHWKCQQVGQMQRELLPPNNSRLPTNNVAETKLCDKLPLERYHTYVRRCSVSCSREQAKVPYPHQNFNRWTPFPSNQGAARAAPWRLKTTQTQISLRFGVSRSRKKSRRHWCGGVESRHETADSLLQPRKPQVSPSCLGSEPLVSR